ncbi:hypothetical protein TRIUR3_21029 [Triticum urartu]|uniref:Uncharacterized protein n=1 Tax=Triticum urartu TaxID=4572 RepID=M7ZVE0_TRIUA|nr:hypothetical protein TRIUR3_21029 [Triticum urartu]
MAGQQGTAVAGGGRDIQPFQLCSRPSSIDCHNFSVLDVEWCFHIAGIGVLSMRASVTMATYDRMSMYRNALEPQTVNKSRLFSVTCDIKEALKHFKSHQINWAEVLQHPTRKVDAASKYAGIAGCGSHVQLDEIVH